jgi:hypothetical protein
LRFSVFGIPFRQDAEKTQIAPFFANLAGGRDAA